MIGVGLDPTALDRKREIDRFRQKVEAGAEFAITQPVFDPDALLRMLDDVQQHGIPIMAGIWPLVSYRNASFMRNEVPGVVVPDAVMERMAAVDSREDQLADGHPDRPRVGRPRPRPRGRHPGQRADGEDRNGLGGDLRLRNGAEISVAFRSAKVAFFRGAKGDNVTVIDSLALREASSPQVQPHGHHFGVLETVVLVEADGPLARPIGQEGNACEAVRLGVGHSVLQ